MTCGSCSPPLACVQDAIARLETRIEAASEGVRAGLAYREAAGRLAQAHMWIHPRDLALRDGAVVGSSGIAALAGRLDAALPAPAGGLCHVGLFALHEAVERRGLATTRRVRRVFGSVRGE